MLERIEAGYGPARRQALQQEIARYRQQPDGNAQVQRLLDPYRRRMYDISVFTKELKGSFAQWFNQRHHRYGVLWAERFKSVLLEGGEAVAAVAAYIELNPVRAALCADPKDYCYCGYISRIAFLLKHSGRFVENVAPSFSLTNPRSPPMFRYETGLVKRASSPLCIIGGEPGHPAHLEREPQCGKQSDP